MPTLVTNAYAKAYPLILNRIRASIYLQSDPQALIASQTKVAPHPERTWSFPGLPRNNYGFSMDEINGADEVINNLALFDVVPGELDGQLVRDDEQIKVGVTPGFASGAITATFDGTGTPAKPNYIGWEIVPSELNGRGILVEGLDYSWDKTTGIFNLLQVGDQFYNLTYYNIHFNPIIQPAGNSYPSIIDFSTKLKTDDYTVLAEDFGSKIICEPVDDYMELTLPTIASVAQGRPLMIEVGGIGVKTVKIVTGTTIKFLRGNIFVMPNESIAIYKFDRSGTFEWRVMDACGQFNSVGQIVDEDAIQVDQYNKQLLDGAILKTSCRLYQEVVLNLPLTQVKTFLEWSYGDNSKYYSFADGSGNFHVPDRLGLFARGTVEGVNAGTYQVDQNKEHTHYIQTGGDNHPDDDNVINGYIQGRNNADSRVNPTDMDNPSTWNMPNHYTTSNGGEESRPKNLLNK